MIELMAKLISRSKTTADTSTYTNFARIEVPSKTSFICCEHQDWVVSNSRHAKAIPNKLNTMTGLYFMKRAIIYDRVLFSMKAAGMGN